MSDHRVDPPSKPKRIAFVAAALSLGVFLGAGIGWACADGSSTTHTGVETASGSSTTTSATTTTPATSTTTAAQEPVEDAAGNAGTTTSSNTANGVTATFTFVDTGTSLKITGQATGLDPAKTYVSLLYPADNCSNAQSPSGETLAGVFQAHGSSTATLSATYTGVAYKAVSGNIGSESVREVTSLVPSTTAPNFTGTFAPITCVDLDPDR